MVTCEIDVVILAGGQGSRLRPVIGKQQKCMASYGGQPFLFHLFACLYDQGFTRVVLALGYGAARVQSEVSQSTWNKKLDTVYSVEKEQLGTAGALRNALPHVRSDEVIVLNGDTFAKLNYHDLMLFHHKQSATLTLAVTEVNKNQDSGFIHIAEDGMVTAFDEKEKQGHRYTSMGVYCMNRSFIERMPQDRCCSLETDIFPTAVNRGVYAYPCEQGFHDIGTPERFKHQVAFSEL